MSVMVADNDVSARAPDYEEARSQRGESNVNSIHIELQCILVFLCVGEVPGIAVWRLSIGWSFPMTFQFDDLTSV